MTTGRRALRLAIDAAILAAIGFVGFLGYGALPNGWYRTVVVAGGSMQPALDPGDIVIVTPPPETPAPGMIVVLQVADRLVTHRVVEVRADGSLVTQGDANSVPDDFGTQTVTVFGQVAWRVPVPGIGGLLPIHGTGATFHTRWVATQRYQIGSWTVARRPQGITFLVLDDRPLDAPSFDPRAVADSGLPIAYAADGPCRMVDGLVELTGAGDCTITASQPGDEVWAPADAVSRTFRATRLDANLHLDLSTLPTVTVGDGPFSVATFASAHSSSPVQFALDETSSGCSVSPDGTVTVLAPATGDAACVIAASVAADDRYRADGPVTDRFHIRPTTPRPQSITFAALPRTTYGDASLDPIVSATSGLPVHLEATGPCRIVDGRIRLDGAGACDVVASQDGDADWLPAEPVVRTAHIAPAPLTVRAPRLTVVLGQARPDLVPAYDGLVGDDRPAGLGGPAVCAMEGEIAAVGSHPVSCTAPAWPDYSISVVPGVVRVVFAPAGACIAGPGRRVLPPVDADGTSVFRRGSTIPVKVRVCDAAGVSVAAPGPILGIRLVEVVTGGAGRPVDERVPTTTPTTTFRWSDQGQLWILNLDTGGLRGGRTYRYVIDLADGSDVRFQVAIR